MEHLVCAMLALYHFLLLNCSPGTASLVPSLSMLNGCLLELLLIFLSFAVKNLQAICSVVAIVLAWHPDWGTTGRRTG